MSNENKKYDIIYADPPWKYNFASVRDCSIEAHYNTMTLEDIKNLKIPSKENCILFLWATAPKIVEALEVLKTWGFKYKTQAIWDKGKFRSMGYWFLIQHEILLVGTKGNVNRPDPVCIVHSIFKENKDKLHSKKPKCVRQWIEYTFAYLHDKLEMFAREKHEGWDVFGNEVENSIAL